MPEELQLKYLRLKALEEKSPTSFLETLLQRKGEIGQAKAKRKQNENYHSGKVRTAAKKQKKLKVLSELADEEEENDLFGLDDKDWDIYVTMVEKVFSLSKGRRKRP